MKWEKDFIEEAARESHIIAGFNVFGYEDAQAVIRAAEQENVPVLLMLNRDARNTMEIEHWAALLCSLAGKAAVPVGVHLDHCAEPDVIVRAIESGFTSVMYDGSDQPLAENIRVTEMLVRQAHRAGVFVEAELGSVPYSDQGQTEIRLTDPDEASAMQRTGADWLAVSVGNIHRLPVQKAALQFPVLERIEQKCSLPLVIHGSSGIPEVDILRLRGSRVGKMNFGTALRQTFGNGLRRELALHPVEFDRLRLFQKPVEDMERQARRIISLLWKGSADS